MDIKAIHVESYRRTQELVQLRAHPTERERAELGAMRSEAMRPTLSATAKFEKLYEIVEHQVAVFADLSPCKKGCAACCHQHVLVTEAEARVLAKRLGRKLKRIPGNQRLTADAANTARRACPFLQRGACVIHKDRPFMCRQHLSVDSSNFWCDLENQERGDFPIAWPKFWDSIALYAELSGGAEAAAANARDIRDWF